MSSRFNKNKPYLLLLSNCKNKFRKNLILNSDKEQIYSICECLLNISNGNIKISETNYSQLKPYSKIFKKILNKKSSLKQKKK